MTAASIEYVARGGRPRITAETMDMLLDVAASEPDFAADFPFTFSTGAVEEQLPARWSIRRFIYLSSTPLYNAIQDARSIIALREIRRPSLRDRSGPRSVNERTGRFNTLTMPDAGESKTEQRAQESKTGGGAAAALPIRDKTVRRRFKTPEHKCKDGQCQALTKRGKQCKFPGKHDGYCKRHAGGHAYMGKKDNEIQRIALNF